MTVPLPTGIAINFIDEPSLSEDESLQDLWASLLVNGMNPDFKDPIERSDISILAELSAVDALIFNSALKAVCGE